MQNVNLKLPLSTLARLHRLAEEEDVSLGQIVRDAVDREIKRRSLAKAGRQGRRRKPLALWRVVSDDPFRGEDPPHASPAPLPRFGTRRVARVS